MKSNCKGIHLLINAKTRGVNVLNTFFSSIGPDLAARIPYGLSALADKARIVSTKLKDKFCRDKFLSCLRCRHSNFQRGKILSTPLYSTDYISPFNTLFCRARQNIEHFGGIMDHVQILVLVPCFVLLNLEKTKRCLWCAFFYGINFPRNQAALLMVEHCRRQRRHNPSSTQPLLLETSNTKPFLVRDPLQWPKKSRRVFQKTTASDGKLNSYQTGRNRFSDKWLTSLAQFCLFCRFLPRFYPQQLLSALRLKIFMLRTKFVRSPQTVRTYEALAVTENLLKLTSFLLVRIGT